MNSGNHIDMKVIPTTMDDVKIEEPNRTRGLNLHFEPKIFLDELNKHFNSFATRKTIAAGFFNLALVTTNFAQMKQLITKNAWVPLNIICMTFVGLSLLLQFVVATLLVFLAKSGEFIDEDKRNQLIRSNNVTTFLVLIITILNIFINVFIMI
jgi:hypothetical protein